MRQSGWEWREWIQCIYMAESLHYTPEAITSLLVGYTTIYSVFGIKKQFFVKIIKRYKQAFHKIYTNGQQAQEDVQHCKKKNMEILSPYLSIITLNINRLNSPIITQSTQNTKQHPNICFPGNSTQL